jgi:MFS family permease
VSWAASFAPLRERNFAWYFASRFVNVAGSMMANVALAFAVLDIGGSATAIGQVLAAHTIPMIALLLYGGVIADRFPRHLVIQASNVGSAISQGLIAALVISGHAEMWMLIVLSVLHGTVTGIGFPAMASVLPTLVPRSQLQPANALISLTRSGLTVVGPTIGGLMVVTVGSGWALAVDASTWFLAALCLLPVRIPPREPNGEPPNAVRELREGWSFFWQTQWLWAVVVGFGVMNAIHMGAWFTLGPAIADQTIGRQGWGIVLSAEAIGLLTTTVVMLRVRLTRPLLFGMIGMFCFVPEMLILGLHPHLGLLVAASFLGGMGVEVFSLGWSLAMQENIEDRLLSRAYSYDALGSFIAMPIGQLLYGPLGDAFGYRDLLVASGVVYAVVVALVLCSPAVRHLPRRTEEVEAATVGASGT